MSFALPSLPLGAIVTYKEYNEVLFKVVWAARIRYNQTTTEEYYLCPKTENRLVIGSEDEFTEDAHVYFLSQVGSDDIAEMESSQGNTILRPFAKESLSLVTQQDVAVRPGNVDYEKSEYTTWSHLRDAINHNYLEPLPDGVFPHVAQDWINNWRNDHDYYIDNWNKDTDNP